MEAAESLKAIITTDSIVFVSLRPTTVPLGPASGPTLSFFLFSCASIINYKFAVTVCNTRPCKLVHKDSSDAEVA